MGKLKTEFTSPMAKSTSPVLSDTTFFLHASTETRPFPSFPLVKSYREKLDRIS